MNDRTVITIEGFRPWQQHQKTAVAIRHDHVSDDKYMEHLKLALEALYYQEVKKYMKFKGIEDNADEEGKCQSTLIAAEIESADTNTLSTSETPNTTQ